MTRVKTSLWGPERNAQREFHEAQWLPRNLQFHKGRRGKIIICVSVMGIGHSFAWMLSKLAADTN